ncbi:peptide chain release factor N(5)-glutamine methyltransferase [Ramlibacter sp.]|uniref:peptide chain release factor N(5)-glutamine methyltransferase n=1 Tax=Ramlibacter sp. TaxID=1917967 RepID=UPI00179783C3|nr:peptide chain release factor N(5)-glutamine methyltransferase [Ramlibacter sp.]MBA2675421.1 peptide chain release factor N(5)-glutamine methyltransferase [Ramlibacter sp.]
MTLAEALRAAASQGLARLDAQLLLLHALGRAQDERTWLIAHDADELPRASADVYRQLCERRAAGEPLAYIVGHKEFFGLLLQVDRRVLVPRPDTETLVEWAVELLGDGAGKSAIDLGTGSGAIALAIKRHCPAAQVEAVDVSQDALAVAQANARALALDVGFHQAFWLAGARGRYDLIASNPPYIAAADPHLASLRHEPLGALAAGADGLDDIRAIAAQAPRHLQPGGWLLLEHGWDQAAPVRELLAAAGLRNIGSRADLAGIARCTGGQCLELG